MESFLMQDKACHLYIVGATGSGKSVLVFDILLKQKLRHKYDEIYIFTTTYESNQELIDSLGIEHDYKKKRYMELYSLLVQGAYDEYIWSSDMSRFFDSNKSIYEQLKKLDEDKIKIILNDLHEIVEEDKNDVLKNKRIFNEFDEKHLNYLYKKKLAYPEENWLFIFDDLSYSNQFCNSQTLRKILKNSRSRKISAWVISQKFHDIPPKTRSNFMACVMFMTSQETEQDSIYQTCGVGSRRKFIQKFFSKFKELPEYSFGFIKLLACNPDEKIYFNFDNEAYRILE